MTEGAQAVWGLVIVLVLTAVCLCLLALAGALVTEVYCNASPVCDSNAERVR